MCGNAQGIAERMAGHRKIAHVCYPGLPGHPAHATARKQMLRFGSLVGVTFDSKAEAERFIQETKYVRPVTSFGGVHTSAERRARWGDKVAEGFVRLSVGCEPPAVLWTDLERVLDAL
jgi:cystathionine gamma-lyase